MRRHGLRVGGDRRKNRLTGSDRKCLVITRTALPEQDENHTDRGSVNHVRRALNADTQATSLGDPPHLSEECIETISNRGHLCRQRL